MLAIPAFRRATAASRSRLVSSMVFHRQANTLVVPEAQLGARLQNAVGVDRLGPLRHRKNTTTGAAPMQPKSAKRHASPTGATPIRFLTRLRRKPTVPRTSLSVAGRLLRRNIATIAAFHLSLLRSPRSNRRAFSKRAVYCR
jgi:hypothetical protein